MRHKTRAAHIAAIALIPAILPWKVADEHRLTTEYHVTVSGQISCLDNGVPRPLANAHVEIMDSDNDAGTFGDDLMGMTDTDATGSFSADGIGGDGGSWSWSRPDVYVRVILDDQWVVPVRMTDELGSSRSWASPQHDHDNVEGAVSIGSWWWGSKASTDPNNATAPCVWLDSRSAVRDYTQIRKVPPPKGSYEILYWSGVYAGGTITPYTSLATTHWPRHYSTHGGITTTHEFYHAVRHGLDGDQAHWDWDDTRFIYGRSHGYCDSKHLATQVKSLREGFAFNEGWAEFAGYSSAGWTPSCGSASADDMTREGAVSDRLMALETKVDAALKASRSTEVARHRMVSVLRDNPGTIHSYDEYCTAISRSLPGVCGSLGAAVSALSRRNIKPYVEVSPSLQRQELAAEIAAQLDTARALTRTLQMATRGAATTRPTCRGEDCEQVFKVLVRPALLEREIRAHELVARRLRMLADASPPRGTSPHEFERAYVASSADFTRQLVTIGSESLKKAIESASRLSRVSPAATPLVDELRRKLEVRLKAGVPNSDRPALLVMEDPAGRR